MKYERGAFRANAEEDYNQLLYNRQDSFRLAKSSCTHAQQYVEKIVKEKFVEIGEDPPRIHDISVLLKRLSDVSAIEIDDILIKASTLSNYYVALRYPDPFPMYVSQEDAEDAFEWACEIVGWIEHNICTDHP